MSPGFAGVGYGVYVGRRTLQVHGIAGIWLGAICDFTWSCRRSGRFISSSSALPVAVLLVLIVALSHHPSKDE